MKKIKFFPAIIIFLLLILFALSITFYFTLKRFLDSPIIPSGQKLIYILQNGGSIKDLAFYLHEHARLKHPYLLIGFAKINRHDRQLQAGEYAFEAGLTPRRLLIKVTTGDVVKHNITFIEGWNFTQLLHALKKAPQLSHTLNHVSDEALMKRLGSVYTNPEGLFFPDTYTYTMHTTDFEILKKAYTKMQNLLNAAWDSRVVRLPYKTPYQALIAASLIQKEVNNLPEARLVSSVIVNRMNKNMYLQIDPTVIYALGENYKGKLRGSDMKMVSPYNTYTNKGLPPGPIAMPSRMSLLAAMHPADTDYFYYVASGNGGHVFSKSLEQHNRAVKKYLLQK